jgi:hypothetical protein
MGNYEPHTKVQVFQEKAKHLMLPTIVFVVFLIYVLVAPNSKGTWTYPDIVLSAPAILRGNAAIAEIASDIYGFRAIFWGLNPYENLHVAMPLLGAEWNDEAPSTHPPTDFLLAAPIAFLPLPVAFAVWAWLMIAAIIFTMRAYHFTWPISIIIGLLAMFWPPTITSLGNFPCVWMLGLALAYRQRNSNPLLSGVWIGVASFTKLLPAVMLVPFIIKRKWSALLGFALSWAVAIILLFILSPSIFDRYMEANNSLLSWVVYIGNANPLIFLYRHFSLPGLGVGLYLFLLIFFVNWRDWLNRDEKITSKTWHLFALSSVILLPIAWIYSISPLLPGLLVLVRTPTPKRLLGLLALLGPVIALFLGWPSAGAFLILLIPYCLYWILPFDHLLLPWSKRVHSPKPIVE